MTKHDAFISYSHRADGKLAKALEEGIEKLAKPLLKLRAADVFRDETGLAANPSLWAGILDHLHGSQWFLLLACPESANSVWCTKEALWWLENRSKDRMLLVWTGGDLVWDAAQGDFDWTRNNCLNPALKGKFSDEPLYVDLRWTHEHERLTLSNVRFRDAVLDLAAPIRSTRKDELDGADVRQLRRNLMVMRAGVAAITIAAAAAVWQAIVATQQRDEAIRQARIALARGLSATARQKLETNPDQALLIAKHAVRLDPGPTSRSALLSAVQTSPRLLRVIRPSARVFGGAFSHDGRRFAAVDVGGGISIWDTGSWERVLAVPDAHGEEIWALEFVPGDEQLVTASLDKTVAVWEVGTGKLVGHKLIGHGNQVLCVAVSPDGRTIVSGDLDGTLRFWDLESQRQTLAIVGVHRGGVRSVTFSTDGSKVVSGGFDGVISVRQRTNGASTAGPGRAHQGAVMRLVFRNDGGWLASAGQDGMIRFWDTASWKEAAKPMDDFRSPGPSEIGGLAFSPDGKQLAAGGWNGTVLLWKLGPEDEIETTVLKHHKNQVWQVAFHPQGGLLASASWDGSVAVWDSSGRSSFRQELIGYTGDAFALAFHPQGTIIAIGDETGKVYLHGVPGGERAASELCGRPEGVTALQFNNSGSMLACGGVDGTVLIWEMNGPRPLLWKKKTGAVMIQSLIFTSDDSSLISTSRDGAMVRWDAKTGESTPVTIEGMRRAPTAFSPDWKYLVGQGTDGSVVLWDAQTGKRLRVLTEGEPNGSLLAAVAFSPDGRRLAANVGFRQHVWRVGSWDSHNTYTAGNAQDIAFGSDSRTLAIATQGSGIQLIDVEEDAQLAEPLETPRSATRIAFSRQGLRLGAAFGQSGFPPMVWDLDLAGMTKWACQLANRDLSAAEWKELAGPLPQPRICGPGVP